MRFLPKGIAFVNTNIHAKFQEYEIEGHC